MNVHNSHRGPITIPLKKGRIVLVGNEDNAVDAKEWEEAKKLPPVQEMIKNGTLRPAA